MVLVKVVRYVVVLLTVTAFVGVFAGCNTVAGVGEDISAGGELLTNAAKGDGDAAEETAEE